MPERRPQPEAGMRARTETDCQRCGEVIHVKDRICYRRGLGDLRRVRERGRG